MFKQVIIAAMLLCLSAPVMAFKTPEERNAEIIQNAAAIVQNYHAVQDTETLSRAYSGIERAWLEYTRLVAENDPLLPHLSLIRARAATAAGAKNRVVAAWQDALKFNAVSTKPDVTVNLNIEAAHAAAAAKDFDAAKQFFAAARAFAFVRGEGADTTRLFMRIRELSVIGGSMSWRELNDALTDLRRFSETFPMWTIDRLEAVLAETELRIRFQPEEKDKRPTLSTLKAEITLIVDGLGNQLPVEYLARVRAVNYALLDNYNL